MTVTPLIVSAWHYRKAITISKTNVNSSLSYFPLLVHVASDSDIGANVSDKTNGYDIRFTDSSGNNLLPYEREDFSVSGGKATGDFWVQIPNISSSASTTIYLYYGNSSVSSTDWTAAMSTITNCTSITNAQCVWYENGANNYVGVWHLNDKSGTLNINDSTINGNSGTSNGVTATTSGMFNGAGNFNGSSYVNLSNPSLVRLDSSFTISSWFNYTADGNLLVRAASGTGGWVSGAKYIGMGTGYNCINTSHTFNFGAYGESPGEDTCSVASLTSNAWYFGTITRNSSNLVTVYVNGAVSNSQTSTVPADILSHSVGIGGVVGGQPGFNGLINEFRYSNVVRPAAWIKFEYCNEMSTASGTCAGGNERTFGAQQDDFKCQLQILQTTGNSIV